MTAYDVARRLPSVPELRDHCRALATLDAVLSPDWESWYHSFDSTWGEGEEMASMRNGQGDEYSVVLTAGGAYIRGFAHESAMSPYRPGRDGAPWPGVLDEVPPVFRPQVEEPAFSDEDDVPVVTVCLWRENTDDHWRHGTIRFPAGTSDPDGAEGLFELLVDRSPEAYRRWAEDYYEVPVDLAAVRHVYALRPLTAEVVAALNDELDLADLAGDLAEIGYPQAD
ncbi:hypothetical protein [Streptomyces sp. CB03911]|uniref:hypothetical protein n=1 Tax=Streptomycetaceae TaxID=2062 RepID=UPI00093B5B37|nr:hypothetical protein [Streptomyces sp. CB03911]OKI30079.1 hypothetical protein A6A07_22465 [Streptomyces sp. CB03911]